ncbi:glycerophosphodiester phosphodiesterase family protein [Halocola ammonii]
MNRKIGIGLICLSILTTIGGCASEMKKEKEETVKITLQGHRGCRGLLPENTIPAFLKAVDLGVTALEMDVVLTADKKVLVSHEAYMHPEVCLKPDGSIIEEEEEKTLNIYKMSADSAQKYICGTFIHPRFLEQRQIKTFKPLLSEVVAAVNEHCQKNDLPLPYFNIEVKSDEEDDGIFHPAPEEFAAVVHQTVTEIGIEDRAVIQSFDFRILRELNKLDPKLPLIALNEEKDVSLSAVLDSLSFKPFGYSPEHVLIDEATVKYCEAHNLALPAWTVNDSTAIKNLLDLGVTNIITDYPGRARKVIEKAGYEIDHPSAVAL